MLDTIWSHDQLSRVIAVVNGKGGVGKTSVVSNLAGLYAAGDSRVLVVDLDPQGNVGNDLGYLGAGRGDDGEALVSAVSNGHPMVPMSEVRPNLDVVAGGSQLEELAQALREGVLPDGGVQDFAASLAQIAGNYDLVLIDCPPGIDALQKAALAAARWVLIPTKSDDASRAGLRMVAQRFAHVRQHYNPDLALLGVVLFGVNTSAKRVSAQAREDLAADLNLPGIVCDTTIRHVEAAAYDARKRGQLVHELERDIASAPKWHERFKTGNKTETLAASAGSLAGDYQRLAEELINRVAAAEQEIPA
jgi:chromosome partitioning protein